MKKKRWLQSTVSFVLIAVMCLGLTLSGNLGRVHAEDTEISLVNANFETDIDDSQGGGWSTNKAEWGEEGETTVRTDEEGHEGQLNFWKKDAGNIVLKQSVELEAGTYQLGVEVIDGENAAISLLFGSETGTLIAISPTGSQSNEFTLAEAGSVEIGVCIAVEAGGWGHIDNISLKKVDTTESTEEGTEEGTESTEEGTEGQEPAGNGVAYQDDMESDVDASWTVTWDDQTDTKSERKISNEAENNTTRLWNFYSPSAQKVVISREITVAAGRYVASVDVDGQNASGKIILSDGAASKDAEMSTTEWDKWTTATTGVLEVADATTLTLAIEVNLQADGWFDLDNVKVVTEKAKKIEELNTLISGCSSLVESEYTAESWQALQNALTTANAVIEDKESKTVEEISGAYQALQTAKEGLVSVPKVEEDITVEKIAGLPKDFIMGMDISSVMSEFASGVTYKDFEGNTIDNIVDFCKLLKANGITHIRVRVWNDPYDEDGHGYGGGNNDVKTAKAIAEGCRAAGLKMLVDFHCSDFWADPYKQQEPKAWYGYTLEQKKEAVKSFICEALNEIDAPKDTVAMVQVGNETINGFVGEEDVANMCTLFQAGAEGVRKYNPEAKVVIQVTEPQNGQVTKWAKNLSDNKVEYDILATSYYPYWHGSLENLKSELEKVKTVYGKEAMVVETSYAYTLADSDGCGNIVNEGWPDGGEDIKQPFTVQGQATAVRDLMSTVNEASGLGVFYWESAWLTVGDTTGLEGEAYEAQVNANREKWETYGSGWASSYAGQYDPDDAGENYGGTAVDNQAMFYPDGTPTAALHVWNYVKTDAVEEEYTINYNLNGGINAPGNPAIYKETDETIVLEDAVKYGYTFAGWYSDEAWTVQVTEIAKGSTGDVTLYAKWTAEEDITVEKIAGLPKDFIMGMDISSVMSEFASGVTYKDFEGNTIDNIVDFCKLLKANGITHIRVRVWNDPYDADGHGYGGGNNDVKTAKAIAEGCRAAGLKMLVDFHCSDFWADPYKQQEPKAWYGYTLEQKKEVLKSFICEALNEIDAPKDTVAMVQVGNETINGFVGEEDVANMCTLFQAGAEGVRKYNPEAKVVIQVTEPQNGQVTKWAQNLSDNKVEYDILATSYYPYWHGSLENLKSELEKVKTVYGKEAMVVETSYAYTLADSDGCGNIVNEGWPDGGEDIKQPFTVQGQATAVRDLMSTVNEASGLGVFYWESAWLTVGDTTGLEGEAYEAQVNANREKWETYGSGWASSYAGQYDPYDAGENYGGNAVENQAMFYPDGTPTAALHVWNYVKEEEQKPGTIIPDKDVGFGAPDASIVSSASELQKAVLTSEELERVKNGEDVKISLKIGEKTATDDEKALIAPMLGKNIVWKYLDISLSKKIGTDPEIQVSKTNGEIRISIVIPKELLNNNPTVKRTYGMFRIHDNVAQFLDGSFDAETGTFEFSTDAFSTYVLVYKDVPVNSESTNTPPPPTVTEKPQYNGWVGVSAEQKAKLMQESLAQNAAVAAPKTDDNAPLVVVIMLLMAGAVVGVGAGVVSKKRRLS